MIRKATGSMLLCAFLFACGSGEKEVTVHTEVSEGGNISPEVITSKKNSNVRFEVNVQPGYALDSISVCGGNLNQGTYTVNSLQSDCTINASFVRIHTVLAQISVGGTISPASIIVKEGEGTEFTIQENDGYVLSDVSGCAGVLSDNTYTVSLVDSDCSIIANFTKPFITLWEVESEEEIVLTASADFIYSYTVDWGDGDVESFDGTSSHTYLDAGTYTVKLYGDIPSLTLCEKSNEGLVDVVQFGDIKWQSTKKMFYQCAALQVLSATDVPNLSEVTDASAMFSDALRFNGDISSWDVSSITNMNEMFKGANSFQGDLTGWDVSAVTDMSYMFQGDAWYPLSSGHDYHEEEHTTSKFNGNISAWDVSAVKNMKGMFQSAHKFNGDISAWNVSEVTDMSDMFREAWAFNGDLSKWDVGAVTDMSWMFYDAYRFNGNLSEWDVSSVKNMSRMFSGIAWCCIPDYYQFYDYREYTFNGDISQWDVSAVEDMSYMFATSAAFSGDISNWNVSSVKNMSYMFYAAHKFNSDLSGWDVTAVTDMSYMFFGTQLFQSDLSSWDVSGVLNMSWMFAGEGFSTDSPSYASMYKQDISSWDVSSVTNMHGMFHYATEFNHDLSTWNVNNVTNHADFSTGSKIPSEPIWQ